MDTLLWLIFCSVFVYTQSTSLKSKPRAVNLALETVIEFDNKDRAYDLRFIDQVQGFLNKVKYVLKKDQNFRRAGKPELKFSDFIRSTLAIINTYQDEDLENILKTFNEEARKFNYRGCRFHELVQNTSFRRFIGKKLDELKEMSLETVREHIDEFLKMYNEGKLGEHTEQLLDYLDSIYEDDASEKIAVVLSELDLYRRDEKQRSSVGPFDTVRKALRSLVFDHYTNLKAKQRKELRSKLESAWNENADEKSHNLFNSYLATDMNRLIETATTKESRSKSSKEDEEGTKPRESNEETTKKSDDSDEDDDAGTTKEKEKAASSSSESEDTKYKKKTTTTSHDNMVEEPSAITTKKKLKLISIESKEATKKKHRKQSYKVAKEKAAKIQHETTTFVQSSIEKSVGRYKHIIFKASQENFKNSDDEDKKQNSNVEITKTTENQLKTTAALQSSIERVPKKSKRIKKASRENSKSSDIEDEVSSTVTTTKVRKSKKDKTKTKIENPEKIVKTKKHKSRTKKHIKKKNNTDIISHNNTETVVQNSSALTNKTTVTIKLKKHRKSKRKQTHEPRHRVAFRNFELSDQDTSDTKAFRSATVSTLATDDVQEPSDYEATKKSRKSFTTPASNEGMSIESFEAHKSYIRKNNNGDSFLPKQEIIKEVVPDVLLNRLSKLEKELKVVKSQITVAAEKQTKSSVEGPKLTYDTLAFWEGTSKNILNENKDTTTTISDKITQRYNTMTSQIEKAIRVKNIEKSISSDFKVITRDRAATTKSFFKPTTKFEIFQKGTTGRVTKTIQFESPNLRANATENDQPINKGTSDKKIFISVENESPNATYEFQVPFNFSNTNIKYEVEVVTNTESTVNLLNYTWNATNDKVINEVRSEK